MPGGGLYFGGEVGFLLFDALAHLEAHEARDADGRAQILGRLFDHLGDWASRRR